MFYKPHDYQQVAYEHLMRHEAAGLFMEMGLGKTVVMLTAMAGQLRRGWVKRFIVIAPKKVCESVWRQEAVKWDHLNHLTFSAILGSERQRTEALRAAADIYLVNCENVSWLVAYMQGRCRFDGLVIDESSRFKSEKAKRFRAVKAILPALKRRYILTGTPRPNTILDLWSQVYILDQGERLGKEFAKFRDRYFQQDPYRPHTYSPRIDPQDIALLGEDINERIVAEKIADICISLQEKDYLKLPELIENKILIDFSDRERKAYDTFFRDKVLALPNADELTAVNAAALTNKLLQFCNGAVYDEDHVYHEIHNEKLDRLEEIVEDAAGAPVLLFYTYQHDLARIMRRMARFSPIVLKGDAEVERWNRGEISLLLAHPASAGHGLNLQAGGNIVVWFGLNWNLEYMQQGVKRLHRQGQTRPVIQHYIMIRGTMDERVAEVVNAKGDLQTRLMEVVGAEVRKFKSKLSNTKTIIYDY